MEKQDRHIEVLERFMQGATTSEEEQTSRCITNKSGKQAAMKHWKRKSNAVCSCV